MQTLLRNLRFGVRMLGKNPGFAVSTILTLALGIGANTAIFTVTSALLLRPFPFHDPEQLVSVSAKDQTKDFGGTLGRYELVRDANQSFQSVAVWTNDNLNLTGAGEPIQVPIARVSPSFFPMLGVEPQLGRSFIDEEGRPEGKSVVILSNAIWRSRFHSDPNIVGEAVTLDTTPYVVVGVLPANVQFPFMGPADIWMPRYFEFSLMTPQRLRMGVGYLSMLARMKPETILARANAELALLNQRYRGENPKAPDAGPDIVMTAGTLRDLVVGNVRGKVFVLSAAVAVVLLIACANVASLLLSRALARKKEIAVRTALGASRGTLVGQLLTESMLLALVAGVLGAAMSWAATRALTTWGSEQLPQGIPIGVDLQVLLFALAVSVVTGVLFGTVPALHLAWLDPHATLRDEGRGTSVGRSRVQAKNVLVVSQIALSLLLFIGAGLLLRSFVRLISVDPGFDPQNVLTMNISLPTVKYSKAEQQIAFFDETLRRVSALPGVRDAAVSAALPLSAKRITPVLPEGQPDVPLAQRPFIDVEAISPQWFRTMCVPLRSGTEFTAADKTDTRRVIIVNEAFARTFWPDQNPIGKHVIIGRSSDAAEVIGVAADVKNKGLEQETQAQLYLPFPQLAWGDMNLLVRSAVPPRSLTTAVRAQIAAVDPDQPVTNVQTFDELMDSSRSQPRFTMLVLGAFSATALALAIIGIYGVLSYSVAQRRQEFGIRLALGAMHADILQLVVRQGLILAIAGTAIGLAASLLLTRLMASMLYKVSTRDVFTFMLTPVLMLCVALLASYLPARRAARVNPIETLR
jgi:putative ABC transport system permease protein